MANALTLVRKPGVYQEMVLRVLSRMNKGTLHLVLPSGESLTMGDGYGNLVASIVVNEEAFFERVIFYGDIGFGEAYVDGLWDTDDITQVIKWVVLNIEHTPGASGSKVKHFALNVFRWYNKLMHFKRANTVHGSRKNIAAHYDLSNDFFATFLDPTMTYSSGYFYQEGIGMDEAQFAKYDRLCRQLHLKPTDHVLEIGSGWGANAIHMATHYGCTVTSVTISAEQYQLAKERVAQAGLEHRVQILLEDYRNIQGKFDKIVSIEMLEAVGHQFLEAYFSKCHNLLKQQGILAIQVITSPDSRYEGLRKGVDWIQKHIFPGSLLPSVAAINKAVNRTSDMTLLDLKDMGRDYATTLQLWHRSFNDNLPAVRRLGFDELFIRKWNYYLCYCEAAFAMRNINVMQLVYARPNNTER